MIIFVRIKLAECGSFLGMLPFKIYVQICFYVMKNFNQFKKISREHKKYAFLVIFCLLFISGYYCFFAPTHTIAPILKVAEVVTVKHQTIEQKVRLIGKVRAKHSALLQVKAPGVLEIIKQTGESVPKGTIIARVCNPDIEKNYEASLLSVQIAKDQFERTKFLTKTGTMSKVAAEEKQSALLIAEQNLANAKIELDKIRFYAPFSGTIGAYKEHDRSEVTVGMPLVYFYDLSQMIVEFDVPAPLVATTNVGQSVYIDGKKYVLTAIQKMLDESTHMAPASVEIDTQAHVVGMSINVDLTVFEKNNVLVLPDDSVFLDQGKPHVYIIKNSKTVLTPVELGLRARDTIEIIKGLNAGDVIVSQAQSRLSNGMEVKIHDPKEFTSNKYNNKSLNK